MRILIFDRNEFWDKIYSRKLGSADLDKVIVRTLDQGFSVLRLVSVDCILIDESFLTVGQHPLGEKFGLLGYSGPTIITVSGRPNAHYAKYYNGIWPILNKGLNTVDFLTFIRENAGLKITIPELSKITVSMEVQAHD